MVIVHGRRTMYLPALSNNGRPQSESENISLNDDMRGR